MNVITVLVLFLCVSSFSQQLRKPRVTEGNKANPRAQTQNEKPESSKDSVRYEYQISEQNKKTQHEEDADAAEKHLYRWYLWATIIGVGLSFGVLVMLILQSIWTRRAANAARDSVAALRNIERPWVVVTIKDGVSDHSYFKSTGETALYFNWSLTNTGKTPAFVYETRAFLEIKTREECEELRHTHPGSLPTIRPDKFIVTPNGVHDCPGIQKDVYWTNPERQAVSKREKFLVAYGSIKYRDSFDSKDTHETPFIGVYVFTEDEFLNSRGRFKRLYDAPAYNKYT